MAFLDKGRRTVSTRTNCRRPGPLGTCVYGHLLSENGQIVQPETEPVGPRGSRAPPVLLVLLDQGVEGGHHFVVPQGDQVGHDVSDKEPYLT